MVSVTVAARRAHRAARAPRAAASRARRRGRPPPRFYEAPARSDRTCSGRTRWSARRRSRSEPRGRARARVGAGRGSTRARPRSGWPRDRLRVYPRVGFLSGGCHDRAPGRDLGRQLRVVRAVGEGLEPGDIRESCRVTVSGRVNWRASLRFGAPVRHAASAGAQCRRHLDARHARRGRRAPRRRRSTPRRPGGRVAGRRVSRAQGPGGADRVRRTRFAGICAPASAACIASASSEALPPGRCGLQLRAPASR